MDYSHVNVKCPDDVIDGSLITKEKRHELFGRVSGGAGSKKPEEYQRQKIIDGTGFACHKTNDRINLRTHTLNNICRPNIKNDGFDYSENFDGLQIINNTNNNTKNKNNKKNTKIYINFKCISGKGGSQTRSLREVYWFVEGQLRFLQSNESNQFNQSNDSNESNNKNEIYFANILDGDEANASMSKFEYIISLPEFKNIKRKIYIGDLKGYFNWFAECIYCDCNNL